MKYLFLYTPPCAVSENKRSTVIAHLVEHCMGEMTNPPYAHYFGHTMRLSCTFHEFYLRIGFDDSLSHEYVLRSFSSLPSSDLFQQEKRMLMQEYSDEDEKDKQQFIKKYYPGSLSYRVRNVSYSQFCEYYTNYIINASWILMDGGSIVDHDIHHPLFVCQNITNKHDTSSVLHAPVSSFTGYAKLVRHHLVVNERSHYYYRYQKRSLYDYPQSDFFHTHADFFLLLPQDENLLLQNIPENFIAECLAYYKESFSTVYDADWKALFLFSTKKAQKDDDLLSFW